MLLCSLRCGRKTNYGKKEGHKVDTRSPAKGFPISKGSLTKALLATESQHNSPFKLASQGSLNPDLQGLSPKSSYNLLAVPQNIQRGYIIDEPQAT